MIETLQTIWLFMKEGVIISVVSAVILPWIGSILLVRRSALLGVAVPQFSAAGIAVGLAVLPWFPELHQEFLRHGHPPMVYLFVFAASAAALALTAFGALASRRQGHAREAQVAAGFAAAVALSLVALEAAPAGSNLVETLQRGSVVVADVHALWIVGVVDSVVFLGLALFTRGIVLISFDREAAVALGHQSARYELVWNILVGASIGVGVMTIGPVLVFGLLFLPPLLARVLARSMEGYLRMSIGLALIPILFAWPASFEWDLAYGPAATLILAGFCLPVFLIVRQAKSARG